MATDSVSVVPSHVLRRALAGMSFNGSWSAFQPTVAEPSGDGLLPALGVDGANVAARLFVAPFGTGPSGMSFSVRLVGWRLSGTSPAIVWIGPFLLAEFLCVTGDLTGPPTNFAQAPLLTDTEWLCDQMALTAGSVGPEYGEVVSPGPGSSLAAFALIELRGCQRFQFDFAQVDAVGMNAFWARA